MNFKEILLRAKAGEEPAVIALLEMYKPLLVKGAIVGGRPVPGALHHADQMHQIVPFLGKQKSAEVIFSAFLFP